MTPSMWSSHNPKLQTAWDATSLNALMTCPTYYNLSIREGWREKGNVDLDFGKFFASSVELYKKERVFGAKKQEALDKALEWLLGATWIESEGHGWGGNYERQWRCTGTEPYKNVRGNRAKCPYSHKGVWVPGDAPNVCGLCGSPTEAATHYIPNHKTKHRKSLIRALIWYVEEQPDDLREGLAPLKLPDGTAAVELSFKLPLPFTNKYGEQYILAGHMDDISELGEERFIADNKTTTQWLGPKYWSHYSPNTQVDTYDLVGSTLYKDLDISGVVIDAIQLLVEGVKFDRQIFYRNDELRAEWLSEIEAWLKLAEQYAETDHWPMARSQCWRCPFAKVCKLPKSQRPRALEADFEKRSRPWNPMEER